MVYTVHAKQSTLIFTNRNRKIRLSLNPADWKY